MVAGSIKLSQELQLFLEAVVSILQQCEVYEQTQDAGTVLPIVKSHKTALKVYSIIQETTELPQADN